MWISVYLWYGLARVLSWSVFGHRLVSTLILGGVCVCGVCVWERERAGLQPRPVCVYQSLASQYSPQKAPCAEDTRRALEENKNEPVTHTHI